MISFTLWAVVVWGWVMLWPFLGEWKKRSADRELAMSLMRFKLERDNKCVVYDTYEQKSTVMTEVEAEKKFSEDRLHEIQVLRASLE